MKALPLTLGLVPLLTGCFVVPEDPTPTVVGQVGVSEKYVHRGMPQNRNWVAQGSAAVGLPTKFGENDSIDFRAWANMDLRDDTGTAWFPNGHQGRLTQIDFIGSYTHVAEDFDVTVGGHNYNVPFGSSFPFGARSSTNALFVNVGTEVLGVRPEIQMNWDFDEANGFYWRFQLSEGFELTEELALTLTGSVGYATENQAWWDYGVNANGLADLQGTATLSYQLDPHTVIAAHVDASTILDSQIENWFELLGIESDNLWGGLFVEWTY